MASVEETIQPEVRRRRCAAVERGKAPCSRTRACDLGSCW